MRSTKMMVMFIASVMVCAALASNTKADCGASARTKALALLTHMTTAPESKVLKNMSPTQGGEDSIVGLWDVIFKDSGGNFFDEGYDQFHADGTEILNDIPNPAFGNVCLGVYERDDHHKPLSYRLHHVFWNFDGGGNLAGRGEWDSVLTLDHSGNNYSGTWTMNNFDLSGNLITSGPLAPSSGTLKAKRIMV